MLVLIMLVSLVALIMTLISIIFPDIFGLLGILALAVAIAGLYFSLSQMTAARVSLRDFCDNCASRMEESFEYINKDISKHTPTKQKVTGYHYEVTDMTDTTMNVKKVLETTTERAGATYYSVKADIKVIQHCPSCNRDEEFVVNNVSFIVSSPAAADNNAIIKQAVFDALQKPQLGTQSASDKK